MKIKKMDRIEFNECYPECVRTIKSCDKMDDVTKVYEMTKKFIDKMTAEGLLNDEENYIYTRKLNVTTGETITRILMNEGTDE